MSVSRLADVALEHLLSQHNVALSLVCIASLVIGLPLAVNLLWHLQVNKCPLSPSLNGHGVTV